VHTQILGTLALGHGNIHLFGHHCDVYAETVSMDMIQARTMSMPIPQKTVQIRTEVLYDGLATLP
jgi:hypothetical protein